MFLEELSFPQSGPLLYLFIFKDFYVWAILKVLSLVQYCFCFVFLLFFHDEGVFWA